MWVYTKSAFPEKRSKFNNAIFLADASPRKMWEISFSPSLFLTGHTDFELNRRLFPPYEIYCVGKFARGGGRENYAHSDVFRKLNFTFVRRTNGFIYTFAFDSNSLRVCVFVRLFCTILCMQALEFSLLVNKRDSLVRVIV